VGELTLKKSALVVKKSIAIGAPVAKVWQVITSPEAMKRWMLVEPDLDEDQPFGLGSKVRWKDETGKPYLVGTVVTFEPARNLVLELQDVSWKRPAGPREVTYVLTLSPVGKATHVAFSLGDLSIDPDAQTWYDAYNRSRELENIKELAEGLRTDAERKGRRASPKARRRA
jgi:uncharacterized protein YndB with AHSA1/START domain